MAANVQDYVLDNGLAALKSSATHVYITSAEATTFTQATSTYALGNKNFGAGAVFPGAIAAGSAPAGRQLATAAITDGSVTATGTATNWAITDNTNSRLLAVGNLSASQSVTSGNTFALPSFTIKLVNS